MREDGCGRERERERGEGEEERRGSDCVRGLHCEGWQTETVERRKSRKGRGGRIKGGREKVDDRVRENEIAGARGGTRRHRLDR